MSFVLGLVWSCWAWLRSLLCSRGCASGCLVLPSRKERGLSRSSARPHFGVVCGDLECTEGALVGPRFLWLLVLRQKPNSGSSWGDGGAGKQALEVSPQRNLTPLLQWLVWDFRKGLRGGLSELMSVEGGSAFRCCCFWVSWGEICGSLFLYSVPLPHYSPNVLFFCVPIAPHQALLPSLSLFAFLFWIFPYHSNFYFFSVGFSHSLTVCRSSQ